MRRLSIVVMATASLVACSSPEPASPGGPASTVTLSLSAQPSASSSAAPSAEPTASATPEPAAGTYLALGDSLAVGVGATAEQARYVSRVGSALSASEGGPAVATIRNIAVSGETSDSMISGGQLRDALRAIAEIEPPVTLVTLDIGGNDLLALLRTDACAGDPLGPTCLGMLAATLDRFEANYRRIVEDLVDALEQHATGAALAVMTYFNPFSGTDASHEAAADLALLGADGRLDCDASDPDARGMNDVIACVGAEVGAVVVDVQPAFVGLGLELTHIGSEDIHANDQGYEAIAEAFLAALAR
jgi:lysophospholipase L1-like esterase